jgi:cytochrome P450
MRIHPSVGLIMERHVPTGGAQICGQYIPGGTIVGINPWVLHRDAFVFPDPGSFIPERWLDSSPEKLAEMEMSFFSFGAGNRTCVGKYISLIEMQKIVPQLLREFEVKLADPQKEWKVTSHWFVQQSGLECVLTKCKKTD